ncbi:hypothetical protein [Rhodococcus sp. H29-C3]|uniref:hypothetical protein n=1 Tax=Rhodococcus sp. H29-C3 TaxID=3046307 RepID=UPI0024B9AAE6|nr:hypothetical protein [Rhodococcus sp. H29-C3]
MTTAAQTPGLTGLARLGNSTPYAAVWLRLRTGATTHPPRWRPFIPSFVYECDEEVRRSERRVTANDLNMLFLIHAAISVPACNV